MAIALMASAAWAELPPPSPPVPSPVQGSLDDLARVVLSYFPDGSGRVVSAEGDRVEIDFADTPGLSAGLLLSVYRRGTPLHHPVTGAVMGEREEAVGEIEIVSIGADGLQGKWVGSPQSVHPEDTVRLPTRVPILVVSGGENDDPLTALLVSALADTGRFKVDRRPHSTTWQQAAGAHYFIRLSVGETPEELHLQMQNTRSGQTLAGLKMALRLSEQDAILERWQYQRLRPPATPSTP